MSAISQKERPRRVDAHFHLWDPQKVTYSWLNPSLGPLYRTFEASELRPLLNGAGIDEAIVVQAMDCYADTDLMLAAAAEHPWIAGVVGWVPLDRSEEAAMQLRKYSQNRVLKGIRTQINLIEDPDWIIRKEVLEGLRVVADFGLSLDVPANLPRHLSHVPFLAKTNPDLPIVIDHLAKPNIREKEWEPWAKQLAAAAECPNVYAKISGLNTTASSDWAAADLKPYIDHAIDIFGAHRIMFGSDWPVALMAGDYGQVWRETNETLIGKSRESTDLILGQTARKFYRL